MWKASTYLRFEAERRRPAIELLARVPLESPERIIDLGCGPGNSTAMLLERYPNAKVIGVDSAPDMIQTAKASGVAAEFLQADVATWLPDEGASLIFSNALFHWVDGHEVLWPTLMRRLAPGGVFAAQLPESFDQPSHQLLRALARQTPFRSSLEASAVHTRRVLSFEQYAGLLEAEADHVDLWKTTYLHQLTGPDAVFRWVEGTALVPIRAALPPEQLESFVSAYKERLNEAYPPRSNGVTLFPFTRLFCVARRR